MISWFLLVPGRFGACLPTLVAFCSMIASLFHLVPGIGFRGLSPYSSGILFHHHLLVPFVPGRVPGLVSLVFWHSVPSSFPGSFWFRIRIGYRGLSPQPFGILFQHHFLVPFGSGYRFGARLPSVLAFCSIVNFCFHLVSGRFRGLSP